MIDILSTFFMAICYRLIFSLVSQMGFFAYLTVTRFGLGIFKSVSLMECSSSGTYLFPLFDLVYFRYKPFWSRWERE